MKVLIAVDDSMHSKHSARFIATAIRPEATEVLILHVIQQTYPPPPEMDPRYAPELEEKRKPVEGAVHRVAEQLESSGFKASTTVRIGDVRQCILDLAAEWGADLIVLGANGYGGLKDILLGSVAEYVARRAHCSISIVRPPSAA